MAFSSGKPNDDLSETSTVRHAGKGTDVSEVMRQLRATRPAGAIRRFASSSNQSEIRAVGPDDPAMGFFASYRARIRRHAVAATAPDPDVRDQVDRQMRRGPWFREVGVASSAFCVLSRWAATQQRHAKGRSEPCSVTVV